MFEQDFIRCQDYEVHVRVWNRNAKKTVICWHGLARTGADFTELAESLAHQGFRVLAPDTIGRGLSQWADNASTYEVPVYLNHAQSICEYYQVESCTWVGTSMGGIIGMVAATSVLKDKIDRLVINDIGPEIPSAALTRIVEYVSDFPAFETLSSFECRIRELYAPFGERSEQQWHQMAQQCSRRLDNGQFVSHYDPKIVQQFDPSKPPVTLWGLFEMIECPLMLVHGLDSDVLTEGIVDKMQAVKPNMHYLPVKGCGHAPGLHTKKQITPVADFISS
ncbi:alpha/beta fold hydrolase [Reinekea marina]|uniref:Alpha/beta fold hydrolase n=1 Tax=Reinekea marina TaxID=1310421 RepID=A0ABV7WMN8_9GAMM|nr:alpha/beta fold hydrolase [Reinekea marina]MDN3650722.1 alpha/beta fold hydrolase [Reinekea marina]